MLLEAEYAERLIRKQTPPWKRYLDVQAPYRWNLRRLKPGRMLDVGCGIGRSLSQIPGSVGVDPNPSCVQVARSRGFAAFTPETLNEPLESFDSVLIAHVLEHLRPEQADDLFDSYLKYLKPGGQLIMITPQEASFATDVTHINFLDLKGLSDLAARRGLKVERAYSFPFPRWAGRLFVHAEFVVTARKPA